MPQTLHPIDPSDPALKAREKRKRKMASESIKNLAAALAAAQAEMPSVPMNSVNPFLKNKFADLGAVINTSRPVLAKHGLSISQFPISTAGMVGVHTMLMHTSGEWLAEEISLPLSDEKGKSAAQVAGSIITYLRRYSWSSVLGLYADEDTDGNHPEGKKEAPKAAAPKSEPKQVADRPYPADVVKGKIVEKAFAFKQQIVDGKLKFLPASRQVLAAQLTKIFPHDTQRYEVSGWLADKASTKDMSPEYVLALLGWLGVKNFEDQIVPAAAQEAVACHAAALKAQGQMEMTA